MKKVAMFYLITLLLVSIGLRFFGFTELEVNMDNSLTPPDLLNPFGFDALGRDLLIRSLLAASLTVFVGMTSCLVACLIGVVAGGGAALLGSPFGKMIDLFFEVMLSIPTFVFVALISAGLRTLQISDGQTYSFWEFSLAIGIGSWFIFARWTYQLMSELIHSPLQESALAIGCSKQRILFKHLLPQIGSPVLAMLALQLPQFLLFESALSFFGLGLQSQEPTWGRLLQDGWRSISSYPHLLLGPALLLCLTMFSLQRIFESIREVSSLQRLLREPRQQKWSVRH